MRARRSSASIVDASSKWKRRSDGRRKHPRGGDRVPSTSPMFLAVVGFHILAGLACVITGAVAMLSAKGRGGHSKFGTIYFWCLTAVFISATALCAVRWVEDYHLFILGTLSFTAAFLGRRALQRRWLGWATTRHRHGAVLCPIADGFLRGQRKELAPLEGAPSHCLLAGAGRGRYTAHCLRSASPPGRAAFKNNGSSRNRVGEVGG
jgi:uncharacterized membrane protein